MNYVEPIRDREKVHELLKQLEYYDPKYKLLGMLGIYTALRISDILPLKVKDVREKQGISIKEKKTGKRRIIIINPQLKKTIVDHCKGKSPEDYLFKSREGKNSPITRQRAFQVIKECSEAVGLENIATHSMRKTFGYLHYEEYKDIAVLQRVFNHSTPEHTLRYIGVQQNEVNNALQDFRL